MSSLPQLFNHDDGLNPLKPGDKNKNLSFKLLLSGFLVYFYCCCFGFFGFSFYSMRKVTNSQGFCTHFLVTDPSNWGGRRQSITEMYQTIVRGLVLFPALVRGR